MLKMRETLNPRSSDWLHMTVLRENSYVQLKDVGLDPIPFSSTPAGSLFISSIRTIHDFSISCSNISYLSDISYLTNSNEPANLKLRTFRTRCAAPPQAVRATETGVNILHALSLFFSSANYHLPTYVSIKLKAVRWEKGIKAYGVKISGKFWPMALLKTFVYNL